MMGGQRWPYRPDVAHLDWIIVLLALIIIIQVLLVVAEAIES